VYRRPAFLFMGDLVIVARQARLITEAHDRGLAPLLVVTPHTSPGRLAACRRDPGHPLSKLTEVVEVPDATVNDVLTGIAPLLRRYDVRGVLCIGDFFAEPVGVTADCLGLPGAGSAASRISRNKLLQRTALPGLSPRWLPVAPARRTAIDPSELTFPVVVKPIGRFSSLGVRQVHSPARLAGILATYPPDEVLLVEERVTGPEFSVETLVQDRMVIWTGITAKQTNEFGGTFFTEMSHTCPFEPHELRGPDERALREANIEMLHRLGFADGISHAEFRLSPTGPVLMEVATRLPGGGITFLWEMATGVPLEPVLLDLALGQSTWYATPRRRARQVYLDHPFGRLRDVTATVAPVSWVERDARWPVPRPVPADAPPCCQAVLVTCMPGDLLGPQTDGEQRSGSVLFDAPLDEATEPLASKFLDDVAVVVDPAEPVSGQAPQ
jgi:hypothetical protein